MGGYLVSKFVKQTKVNSWLAHKGGFDQVGLIQAESDKRARGARILGKANPAMGKE
jgi:hypothetical protein